MSEIHDRLVRNFSEALASTADVDEACRTAVTMLHEFSEGYDWTGIYLLKDGELHLGPYLGPPSPHQVIQLSSGICGAAASQKKSIIVDDVNADPRFLACSIHTRSEMVVPLMDGDTCLGEIDIDSNQPAFFSDDDRSMVEAVATALVRRLKDLA